ncbi:peptidoglycan-binding protein [Streptomyces antibioticus]|nr:peptidoglycan-binding domain-containing protein [Streptomyces antibioticus]KUN28699.1 peptidoglycan-binding protein [Streptomyces antibioticus]
MAETSGHLCPECGAPRGVDNTPSCGCTQRASDALRDAREAEQAAAEDFDPLRIRPYVALESESQEPEATAPVPVVPAPLPDATMQLRPVSEPPQPSTEDLSLFESAPADGSTPDAPRSRGSRHRRTLILATAGALVTVVAAAGLASGLFSYDGPERDKALPKEVRASVPDASTSSAPASPETSAAPARPTSASPTPSASPSTSASPSPSRTSASPTPSVSTAAPSTPAATDPTGTAERNIGGSEETAPPVLRRGAQGDEVVELELRLTQLNLYTRKPGGRYNEAVEDAVTRYQWARGIQLEEYGVYDLATRAKLESETTEP